jgi:hypothetical protein
MAVMSRREALQPFFRPRFGLEETGRLAFPVASPVIAVHVH